MKKRSLLATVPFLILGIAAFASSCGGEEKPPAADAVEDEAEEAAD